MTWAHLLLHMWLLFHVGISTAQQFELPPTSFVQQPRSAGIEISGNVKVLHCQATGSPSPVYQWMRDGHPLSPTNTSEIALVISRIERSDAGNYRCIASNRHGSLLSSAARINVAYMLPFANTSYQQLISVNEGQAVIIDLPPIDCHPPPTVYWRNIFTGVNIARGVRHYHLTLDNQLVILSTEMNRDNGTVFRAEARNLYTLERYHSPRFLVAVNVVGSSFDDILPEIVIPPSPTSCTESVDMSVKMECVTNARPLNYVRLRWYKKSGVSDVDRTLIIADNIKYEISLYGRVLTVNNPTRRDSATYQCEAVFSRPGDRSATSTVAEAILEVHVKPSFVSFPPSIVSRDVDSPVLLQCSAFGIPTPNITWFRNSRPIDTLSSARYSLPGNGSLVISTAFLEDSGVFQCFALNTAGEGMAATWLRVTNSPPVISEAPVNTTVVAGDSVRFECIATGAPRPSITWSRELNDGTVETIDGNSADIRISNTQLVLPVTDVADSGFYVCNATNNVGFDTSNAYLSVLVRTRIIDPPRTQSAIKASRVTLPCGVKRDASVAVSWRWFVGNNEISSSSDPRIVVSSVDGSLTIRSVRNTDIGRYTCYVVSVAGNDSAVAELEVIELPHPPLITSVELSSTSPNAVDITWTPGFDGNSLLLRFTIDFRRVVIGPTGTQASLTWQSYVSDLAPTASMHTVTGLRPAEAYQFQVSAVNVVGQGEASAPSPVIRLPEQPPSGAPRSVIGSARSNSSIVLQWQSPDSADWNGQLLGYVVRYKLSGYPDSTQSSDNITTFQDSVIHELTGLIYFEEYQIAVAAYNSRGVGVFSPDIFVRTSEGRPTAPPRNVTAAAISSTVIAMRWLPPSPQHINGITQGYHVNLTAMFNNSVLSLRRTFITNLTNMLGEQTGVLTGLYKYAEYRLTVVCFTAAGAGPPSLHIDVRTLEDVPDEVASMKFVDVTDTLFTVTWSPPYFSNGVLTGYTLSYVRKDGISSNIVVINLTSTAQNHTVSGLHPTTSYTVQLYASTRVGSGPSRSANVQTAVTPVVPDEPTSLTITDIQATHVLLRFIPGFSGHTFISSWVVEAQKNYVNNNDSWSQISTVSDPDAVSIIVPALQPYAAYRLRLTAVNIAGQSLPSQPTAWFTTLQALPSAPPTAVTVRPFNETALLVRWAPLASDEWNGEGRGYLLRYQQHVVTASNQTVVIDDENAVSFQLTGLGEWMEYDIQLAAFNRVGRSNFTEVIVARTRESVPSAPPTNITAAAISSTVIHVSWSSVPQSEQNGLIRGYKIHYKSLGQSDAAIATVNSSSTMTFNLTALKKFVMYQIQMLAYTAVGDGVISSSAISVRTFEDVPGPPSSVYFPEVTETSVRIAWSEPREPNGVITGYRVAYSLRSSRTLTMSDDSVSAARRDYRVTGLASYQHYLFTVTAKTQSGWGAEEFVVVYTVSFRRVAATPTLIVLEVGDRWVEVGWVTGDDRYAPVRNFTLQKRRSSYAFTSAADHVPSSLRNFTIEGLRPYNRYQFRIAATNDVGMSNFSVPSPAVRTLEAAPDSPPTSVTARTVSPIAAVVSWTPAPSETWNGVLTGYEVAHREMSATDVGDWSTLLTDKPSINSVTVNNLSLYVTYEVKVRTVNSVGVSVYSPTVTLYTELAPLKPPRHVRIVDVRATNVSVAWLPPDEASIISNVLGYKVRFWDAKHNGSVEQRVFRADDNFAVLTNLFPYTQYTVSVLAYSAAGDGPANSPPLLITTAESAPDRPGSLSFIVTTPSSVLVSWTVPSPRPNGIILHYELSYYQDFRVDGESRSSTVQLTPNRTSYFVQQLIESMVYMFRVRARTSVDWGKHTYGNVTIGQRPGCPQQPGKPQWDVSGKFAVVRWKKAAVLAGDPPVTLYIVQAKERSTSGKWDTVAEVSAPDTTASVSLLSLSPQSQYIFRVFAVNARGLGHASHSSDFLLASEVLVADKPFYQRWWFLVIIALVGVIIILVVVGVLYVTGKKRRRSAKRNGVSRSELRLSDIHLSVASGNDDEGGFPTFELHPQVHRSHRRSASTGPRARNARPTTRTQAGKPNRSGSLPTRIKHPPRPSPGRVNYNSDDDDQKTSPDNSSTLSDKASELSTARSQASDSDTESGRLPPVSFTNHSVNGNVQNSWSRSNRQSATRDFNPYSFEDSDAGSGSTQQNVGLNGGHVVVNNVAGSRAPLPGFSSFV